MSDEINAVPVIENENGINEEALEELSNGKGDDNE